MKKILFIAFFVGSFVLSAQENSGSSATVDSEFKTETIKLIKLTSMSVFSNIVGQMSAMVTDANREAFEKEAETSLNGLLSEIADVYMQEFTHSEIKDMIAFYETPTGKKMADKTGVIMQKSMSIGQSWGMKFQEIVQKYSN